MIPANWISELVNHLWQSTVLAGIVWLLALALRKNQAHVRYRLWLIASLKFLAPFSFLFAIGSHFRSTMPAPTSHQAVSAVVEQIARPFPSTQFTTTTVPAVAAPTIHLQIVPVILFECWACGFFVVACSWFRRWLQIQTAVRSAAKLPIEADIPVLCSQTMLEPGVFGIVQPVLLLPEGITDRLSPSHLRAIIAHEMCHVRRRDNLFAAIHMAVEAIFWFYPMVWWIGSRLMDERERACDEEVLRHGSEPEMYAESILKACQFYLESPLACVSGITGSDLKKRIVRIMTESLSEKLTLSRKLLLTAVGVAAIAGPLLFGVVHASQTSGEPAADAAERPTFEVASVKPNNSGDRGARFMIPPGRFTARNVTVRTLIEYAYNVRELQVSGGPKWVDSEHWDIDAKTDLSPEEMRKRYPDDPPQGLRLMLQSLLADRFQLVLARETKEAPVYALVVAKNGPKLHESAVPPPAPTEPGAVGAPPLGALRKMRASRGQITAEGAPIQALAAALSGQVGRLVMDKTGLKGTYDWTLQWTPEESQGRMFGGEGGPDTRSPDSPPAPDPNGPTIFTALQEQLGLKLESEKGPIESLVIQHIERPSAN